MSEPERASLAWRKSSLSGNGPGCVEVAVTPAMVYVRHFQNEAGPVLEFRLTEWAAFLAGVHLGEFEVPA